MLAMVEVGWWLMRGLYATLLYFCVCLKVSIMEGKKGGAASGNLGTCCERAHFLLTSIPGSKILMGENGVCFLSPHKAPGDGSMVLWGPMTALSCPVVMRLAGWYFVNGVYILSVESVMQQVKHDIGNWKTWLPSPVLPLASKFWRTWNTVYCVLPLGQMLFSRKWSYITLCVTFVG